MRLHPLPLAALAAVVMPLMALRAAPQAAPAATADPHGGKQLDCARCHDAESWTPVRKPRKFSHDATGFRLEGAHAQVSCRDCHRTLVFDRVGTACADCHRDAHQGQLGFRCEACHTAQTWAASTRTMGEAHARTRFPLTGRHANVDCEACHRGQEGARYATTPTDCASCHLQSFLSASNPSHATGGFSRSCEGCHTTSGWRPATGIDHSRTRFPLIGAHALVSCTRCHVGGRYAGTPFDCWSCHQSRYTATTNPNHAAAGFPHTCQSCHTQTAWRPAAAVDHSQTRFPLTGAHQAVDCARCHVGGRFTGTPIDCWSCHQAGYQATTNPNHGASSFPRTCESCHTTSAWRPASFDHATTSFPLTGAHAAVTCARCHTGGRYAGTPSDCWSCHQSNYNGTTNPNHAAASFPHNCQSCHSTSAWRPASFDHGSTRFPLTGAHRSVDCTRCHQGGRYTGTPTDCYSCHQADYNGTSNPNHRSAGFPTSCQECHTTGAWRPASFNHDGSFFPIYSGRHRGVWSSCAECHVNPGNYRVFECINCHEHNRADTDRHHREVRGYQYSSPACYSCHPRGVGGD